MLFFFFLISTSFIFVIHYVSYRGFFFPDNWLMEIRREIFLSIFNIIWARKIYQIRHWRHFLTYLWLRNVQPDLIFVYKCRYHICTHTVATGVMVTVGKKWSQWFKLWMRLLVFHIVLMPLVWWRHLSKFCFPGYEYAN